ncbi:MAG: DUF4167 domain-containing protein [Rhodospirillales bacterium]|nr:DUF4167 domain-containing protein [Rhodospirillales bacterium]
MKNGSNQGSNQQRRGRGRNSGGGGKRHSNQRSHSSNHESNGPEGKVRGTAQQVLDKYLSLARDATSSGEHIAAEGYYQYAEHYYRVIDAANAQNPNQNNNQNRNRHQNAETQEQPVVATGDQPVVTTGDQPVSATGGQAVVNAAVSDEAPQQSSDPASSERPQVIEIKSVDGVAVSVDSDSKPVSESLPLDDTQTVEKKPKAVKERKPRVKKAKPNMEASSASEDTDSATKDGAVDPQMAEAG